MKPIIVYYSLTGNTNLIAKMIGERIGADLVKLTPEKEIPTSGVSKYFLGGKSVMLNEKPKLLNNNLNLDAYDTLIIGTPIWARNFTPSINTFLSEYVIKGKNVYLFATHGQNSNADQCFARMKERLIRNTIRGTMQFEDVKKMSAKELDDKVRKFCMMIGQ